MSSPAATKKPRKDAVLKNLPISVMVDLVQRCATGTGLLEAVDWLRSEHGVESNKSSLGESLPYLEARVKAHLREQAVEAMLEEERRDNPTVTDAELFTKGQRWFARMALADEDAKTWTSVQALSLERDRFREQVRGKLEAGLDAVAEAFSKSPEAMELYQRARKMIQEVTA